MGDLPRRTQAERSASTQGALLDATVATLVERGYRRTTTTDVARRAGVSPGALLHHYPTKADLLCAAVSHLFDQRLTDFRKAMADLPPGTQRGDAAVDVLWQLFAGPTFAAWLELWVAARTDEELAGATVAVDEAFVRASEDAFREVFADETAVNPELPRIAVSLTFSFLSGVALARALPGYEPFDAAELVGIFKLLIAPALPASPDSEETARS